MKLPAVPLLVAAALLASLLLSARSALADEAPLAKTLDGESCHFAGPLSPARPGSPRTRAILCSGDTSESGTLFVIPLEARLPDEPGARDAAIASAVAAMPGGFGAAQQCDGGQKLAADSDARIIFCVLASSGWPRIVLFGTGNDAIYAAKGLPSMLPVLQSAIAAGSGHSLSASATEAAIRLVEARYPELARAGGADVASYKALLELARLAGAERDYAGAEAAYRRVLEIETRLFGETGVAVGDTLAALALEVSNQGRFDEAAGLFRRAEPIIEATTDAALRARFASYRALDAANQRKFADALKFARTATQMRRAELAAPDETHADRGELAHSLRIEAMMAMRTGDLSTALADATEVLRIIADEPNLPLWWRPEAVAMMADVDARRERVVEAERQYRDAVTMDRKLFGDTAPTAFMELRLGEFYVGQQVYTGAVDTFRPALAILGRDEVARAGIEADQIVPFLTAADALAKRDPAQREMLEAEAFRASQLIGSDVADRTVARAAAQLAADNPALAKLLRDLEAAEHQRDATQIELAAETAKPDDRRDAARERKLAADVDAASHLADQLEQKVRDFFPDYARFAEPGPAELGEVEHRLARSEAFLSFVIGTRTSYALLVTSGGLTFERIDLGERALAADVAELRTALVPRLGGVADFDTAASYELYHKLLAPLAPKLAGIDHLIVVPSGALTSLPLSLLVTAPPAEARRHDYAAIDWLVRRLAISELPSPRDFLSLRSSAARHVPAPLPLLAVADPAFTGAAVEAQSGADSLASLAGRCREDGPIDADLLRALPPLKETANEVRTVAKLLGANDDSLLLGAAATEASFRAWPLAQYRVIYFATHGLLPGELHCEAEPGLVLSPPASPAQTKSEDGLLEASEISGLRLDADLVVLSACNTATAGQRLGGEALAGLADSFFNAGARAVLASHWQVPSLSTVKLMTELFTDLEHNDGRGLAQSLRDAQLAVVRVPATAHPFYWAAFVLIGDGVAGTRITALPNAVEGKRGPT